MKINLHIQTMTCFDGNLSIEEVLQKAKKRNIGFLPIADHDSIGYHEGAIAPAREYGIICI